MVVYVTETKVLFCRTLRHGLEVNNGDPAIVDSDHCEVGGPGGKGLLLAPGRGDLEDAGDEEDVEDEDPAPQGPGSYTN